MSQPVHPEIDVVAHPSDARQRWASHRPGARTFATLFVLESFARAGAASVVPLQAYDLLQDKREVALLYTAVSLCSLVATLSLPLLLRRVPRRWVYSAGALALTVGSALLVTHSVAGQAFGMLARVIGAGALYITLNLYIMDHVRKSDLVHVESVKMAWSTLAWTIGPTLGVFLYTRFGLAAAHGAVAVFALTLLACFWFFRLTGDSLVQHGAGRPVDPLANIGRFVAQPRLRLAWLIAFGRSSFWATFYVYGPILMVATGNGKLAGGMLVSAGNALLVTALLWGRLAQRRGARATISGAFLGMSGCLFLAGAAGESAPFVAGAGLLGCAFFAVALDALGGMTFMRAVHPFERAQMGAVYRTYLDLSDLLPPFAYSFVLLFVGLGGVFATLACLALFCGVVSWRSLPRGL